MSEVESSSPLTYPIAEQSTSDPERFRLGMAEKAVWRKATDPAFRGRPTGELAQALCAELAEPDLLIEQAEAALRNLRAGHKSGLRFFLDVGRERYAHALAKTLRLTPEYWVEQLSAAKRHALVPSPGQPLAPEPVRAATPTFLRTEPVDVQTERARFEERLHRLIADGAAQAAAGDPLIEAALAQWAVPVLTELALELLRRDMGPLGTIERPEQAAERVLALYIQELSSASHASRTDGLRTLRPLLGRFPDLAQQAGWLSNRCFADPILPALLAGRAVARMTEPRAQGELLTKLGRDRRWSVAAAAAVTLGVSADRLVRPLLDETDPLFLPDRTTIAVAALSSGQPGSLTTEELRRAFTLGMSGMVWLFPAQQRQSAQLNDRPSPWLLDRETWQQSILWLAQAEERLRPLGDDLLSDQLWQTPPEPLGSVVSALGLPSRLDESASRAVLALCAPRAAVRSGWLTGSFWREIFDYKRRLCALFRDDAEGVDPALVTWTLEHGGPALLATGDPSHLQALAEPGENNPAGFLLNHPSLIPLWAEAWERLLSAGDIERAIAVWVQAALRHLSHEEGAQSAHILIAEQAPACLRSQGLWEPAVSALRVALTPDPLPDDPSEAQLRNCSAVLRLAELAKEEWERRIAEWTEKPTLAWQLLLAAGAPHAAIARWCIDKLRQKKEAGPEGEHGPPGIIVSPQPLAIGKWQLAFQQADQALAWLLDYGDEESIALLADAAMPHVEGQKPFDPIMLRAAGNVPVRLSMYLWHKVIGRPEGRRAFYARAEQGLPISGFVYFPGAQPVPWLVIDSLWLAVTNALLAQKATPKATSTEDTDREAVAMFRAYRAWYERTVGPGSATREPGTARYMVTLVTAMMGVDVEPHFSQLIRGHVQGPAQRRPLESQWGPFNSALLALIHLHPKRRDGILAALTEHQVLCALRADDSQAIWKVILSERSLDTILPVFEQAPGSEDIGLGLFDTLCEVMPERMTELQLRPDFLRPVLIRSVEGQFVPQQRFWTLAWQSRPEGLSLDALGRLPGGEWLTQLIAHSTTWPAPDRLEVLRHLATFAQHAGVRRQCLLELLTMGPVPASQTEKVTSHD